MELGLHSRGFVPGLVSGSPAVAFILSQSPDCQTQQYGPDVALADNRPFDPSYCPLKLGPSPGLRCDVMPAVFFYPYLACWAIFWAFLLESRQRVGLPPALYASVHQKAMCELDDREGCAG